LAKYAASPISGSVGFGGMNIKRDVVVVQRLLNLAAAPLEEDGRAGRLTIGAIRRYQANVLRYPNPDSRIDPNGRMLRSLASRAVHPAPRPQASQASGLETMGRWAGEALTGLQSMLRNWIQGDQAQASRAARVRALGARTPAPQPSGGGGRRNLTDADFTTAARRLSPRIDPLLVKALAVKESRGKSGFAGDGRIIIAFEGHKFRKHTGRIYDISHPKLSYAYSRATWHAKWVINNRDHATAWRTLEAAMALDHDAALKSTSFGAFQVLGENHRDCGFPDVDDFVNLMKSGESGQLEAFVRFCKAKPGLVPAMERQDFGAIGTSYNGAAQQNYDSGLKAIYDRLKAQQ
jgi:hypothetical protein